MHLQRSLGAVLLNCVRLQTSFLLVSVLRDRAPGARTCKTTEEKRIAARQRADIRQALRLRRSG